MHYSEELRGQARLNIDSIGVAHDIINLALDRASAQLREKVLDTMVPNFVQKQAVIFAAAPLDLDMHNGDQNEFLIEVDEDQEPVSRDQI